MCNVDMRSSVYKERFPKVTSQTSEVPVYTRLVTRFYVSLVECFSYF